MKYFSLIAFLISLCTFAQKSEKEIELIKTYKSNIVAKDINATISTLHDLIDYYEGNSQFQLSLGYLYQLKGDKKKSKVHLSKGRTFVLDQLHEKKMSNDELMDHVVALCFAGFKDDCESSFIFFENKFINDPHYTDYEFETVQKLGERQRVLMKDNFNK